MCGGYDRVVEQNKDRWQWINSGMFHSKADFTDRKSCTAYMDKNLPSFMKYNIVHMNYSGQDWKVNGQKVTSLSTSMPY